MANKYRESKGFKRSCSVCECEFNTLVRLNDSTTGFFKCKRHRRQSKKRAISNHCPRCDENVECSIVKITPVPLRKPHYHCNKCGTVVDFENKKMIENADQVALFPYKLESVA